METRIAFGTMDKEKRGKIVDDTLCDVSAVTGENRLFKILRAGLRHENTLPWEIVTSRLIISENEMDCYSEFDGISHDFTEENEKFMLISDKTYCKIIMTADFPRMNSELFY